MKKAVQQPVLSVYVFSLCAPRTNSLIVRTPGVVRLLGDGGAVIAIPEREIEAVRRLVETARSYAFPLLREGIRFSVRGGPLKVLRAARAYQEFNSTCRLY